MIMYTTESHDTHKSNLAWVCSSLGPKDLLLLIIHDGKFHRTWKSYKIVKHQVIVDSNNWKDVDRKLGLLVTQTKQEQGLWTRDDQQAFGRFDGPRIQDSESRISGSRWLEAIGRISKFYVHEPWRERAVTCSRQTNRLNNKWRFFTKQLINRSWLLNSGLVDKSIS